MPADKGFIDAARQAALQEQGVLVVTRERKNSKLTSPHSKFQSSAKSLCRLAQKGGNRRLANFSQLSEHFAIGRIRVRDLWHLQHRLIRKVLAHTVAVFLNLQLGRPPLDLDDLVLH